MLRLAACYREAVQDRERIAAEVDDLEARLWALHARGAAAHRDLTLGAEVFARHLALCGVAVSGGIDDVHAEDLFLSCAALTGQPAAIDKLRRTQAPVIAGYLRRVE